MNKRRNIVNEIRTERELCIEDNCYRFKMYVG